MRKKIESVILILSMLVVTAIVPLDASYGASGDIVASTEGVTGGAIYFDKETGTVTDCDDAVSEVVMPEKIENISVTQIKFLAFSDCTLLTGITIPKDMENIGADAFKGCTALSEITVSEDNTSYSSEDGVLFNKDKTILYKYPAGKTAEEYVIPDTVKIIRDGAFENCTYLKKVTIADITSDIGDGAFAACDSLTICGSKNSYAEYYATKNNIPFVDMDADVVAMIGEIRYKSLQEAFADASGNTIDLLKDVSLEEPLKVSTAKGDVKINLNGCSIGTTGNGDTLFDVDCEGNKEAGTFYIFAGGDNAVLNGKICLGNDAKTVIEKTLFKRESLSYKSDGLTSYVELLHTEFSDGTAGPECISLKTMDEAGHLYNNHIYRETDIYFVGSEIEESLKQALNIDETATIEKWANNVAFNNVSPLGDETAGGRKVLSVKNDETISDAIDRNLEYIKANYPDSTNEADFYNPSCEGYNFAGWYTADVERNEQQKITKIEYKELIELSGTVTADMELYSKWQKREPEFTDISDKKIELAYRTIEYNGNANEPAVTIEGLEEGVDFTVKYSNNIYAGQATVTVEGIGKYTGSITETFEIIKPDSLKVIFGNVTAKRFYGRTRYETAMQAAKVLKVARGIDKFDSVIVAYGDDYADALAGSYLAKVKNAPILLVNRGMEAAIKEYIDDNLKENGTVYILGGTGVISTEFEKSISKYSVIRLGGKDRFETNLLILKEAGATTEDILVCSGFGFADALSASAVGKPIMLVGDKLTAGQKIYLGNLVNAKNYHLIGGTGAVSSTVEKEFKDYGDVKRIAGSNRFETSEKVARAFFGTNVDVITVAYAMDFPDGLCGGPMAMELGGPLILVTNNDIANVKSYVGDAIIRKLAVLGGDALISNRTANEIIR